MDDNERQRWYRVYNDSFIVPADPFRYNVETRSIPRRRDLFQVNRKGDIARGWRAEMRPSMIRALGCLYPDDRKRLGRLSDDDKLNETDELGNHFFFRQEMRCYRRLDSCSEKTGIPFIVSHFCKKAKSPNTNLKWYLVQDARTAKVNYLQFDLDMHDSWSNEGWAALQEKAERVEEVVPALGGQIIWTTSPGDMFGDRHVQGVYAWIKLDQFHEVGRLIELKQRIKQAFNLPEDTEFSWDNAYRPIRLPGQQWVELVDPRTMKLLHRVGDKEPQRKAFDAFCEAWHNAKHVSLEALLSLAPEPEVAKQKEEVAETQISPLPRSAENGVFKDGVDLSAVSLDPCSTWNRGLTVASFAMHRHNGCSASAKETVLKLLPEVSPGDSRTCSDPRLLGRMVSRIISHFSATFKPINKRRAKDKKRFEEHTLDADVEDIIRVIGKHVSLKGVKNKLRKLLGAFQSYTGRIACKTIYDDPDAIFGKREWFRLNGRIMDCLFRDPFSNQPDKRPLVLSDFICIIDGYSFAEHKCRQYGFSSLLRQELKQLQESREKARAMLDSLPDQERGYEDYVSVSRAPGVDTSILHRSSVGTESDYRHERPIRRSARWQSVLGCLPEL
jgi:hypothetical protein